MDRRLIAGLLGLALAGCALSRSKMPAAKGRPQGQAPPVQVGEVEALPPAGAALAKVYADHDASTRRASQAPESPPIDDPPLPTAAATLPPGRPAPFAGRSAGSPRAQVDAVPATIGPRPAPFADQAPPGPRPQSPGTAPAASAVPAATPIPDVPAPAPAGPPAPAPPEAEALPPVSATAPTAPAPAPAPEPAAGMPPSPFADAPAPAPAPADPQVRPTSFVAPAGPPEKPATTAAAPASAPAATKDGPKPLAAATNGKAAMVGTEVITLRQVYAAMVEKKQKYAEIWSKSSAADKQKIFAMTLNSLIDRALLVQAAKKKIKDLKVFNTEIDRHWTDAELPPLLREHGVSNIHELKRKLADGGRSLDQIREDYRLTTLAREFMAMQIKDKLHVSLPEMMAYYEANREKYRRPAELEWREVEVEIAKCPSRDEAKARAEAIVARLRKGEDFARLAKAASHGATARDGGLWKTAPGSSANPDINAALASLPPGQVGPIIEAPGSFHILRVDSRREAGIAEFYEVQDQIKEELTVEKGNKAADALLDSLRKKTVVTTIFDEPDNQSARDPGAIRTGAKAPAGR